jgi:glutamate carboxypeptidase
MDVQRLVLDVEAYTQQRLSSYIEELGELCAIDSGSYYKPGLDQMAFHLEARMRGMGMETVLIEHEDWGNDLLGIVKGKGKGNVLLLGHMDTVYPLGTAAARPVCVEGNTIKGPGVSDMKGCVLSALYAVEALLAMDCHSFGEIRFLCVSDEEIMQRHSVEHIQRLSENCQQALVLEAARASGAIVSARKGNAGYTLAAHGRSAHAGVEPEKGRNAIVALAYQTLQLQNLQGWREGITINPGRFQGGTALNVVPDYAEVQIDVRFVHMQDLVDMEKQWRAMIQQNSLPGVEIELKPWADARGPMDCTPASLQLVKRAQGIANLLSFSVEDVLTGGSSDASYTSSYGVPTLDGLGPIGGLDHSPDEYLLADSVAPRAALLAGLIASVDTASDLEVAVEQTVMQTVHH